MYLSWRQQSLCQKAVQVTDLQETIFSAFLTASFKIVNTSKDSKLPCILSVLAHNTALWSSPSDWSLALHHHIFRIGSASLMQALCVFGRLVLPLLWRWGILVILKHGVINITVLFLHYNSTARPTALCVWIVPGT